MITGYSGDADKFFISRSNEYIHLNTNGNINPQSLFIRYHKEKGKEWLYYGNEHENEIIIYSLPDGTIKKRIKFERRGPNGVGKLAGFLIQSPDSILVGSFTHYKTLFLTDTTGILRRKVTLKHSNIDRVEPGILPMFSHLYNQNTIQNGKINISTYQPYAVENKDLHAKIISVEYDLIKDSVTGKTYYPHLESEKNADLSVYSRAFNGSGFIYSFFYAEDIYISDKQGNYRRYPCKSQYQIKSLSYRFNVTQPIESQMHQIVENPKYLSCIYDEYRNCIYRYFYPGIDISRKEHPRKYVESPKVFSIIIIDKDFNVDSAPKTPFS